MLSAEDFATDSRLRTVLASIAPGTDLRDGFERILRGRTGALVVLGAGRKVSALCTGGFELDVPFSAAALRELSKMDGAIVLSDDLGRIVRAATHLMPDPAIPTEETGTRHRTADRVARETGLPVVSVSQSMRIIALYVDDQRYVLEGTPAILSRANQALATLERYKMRLDEVSGTLSALEIEGLVTVRDVAAVAQRLEMVRRIATEIEGYVIELGTDGRLMNLQLNELIAGVAEERDLIVRDYVPEAGRWELSPGEALSQLSALDAVELLDPLLVAKAIGLGGTDSLDSALSPRGYRLLAKVPRLPATVIDRLINTFGTLEQLLRADADELQTVEGVGEQRARLVRDGLSRLAESSILDRYV